MFVEASAPVPLPVAAARAALATALAADGLVEDSSRAYSMGLSAVHSIEARRLTKQVQVRTLTSREVGATTILPLRWEATGPSGHLFPVLDADLCLTPVNEVTSLLSIVGRYEPPLGMVGEIIDRTALAGAAQSSVDAFLRELAATMRLIAASHGHRAESAGASG